MALAKQDDEADGVADRSRRTQRLGGHADGDDQLTAGVAFGVRDGEAAGRWRWSPSLAGEARIRGGAWGRGCAGFADQIDELRDRIGPGPAIERGLDELGVKIVGQIHHDGPVVPRNNP